jgi:hypothetical protein
MPEIIVSNSKIFWDVETQATYEEITWSDDTVTLNKRSRSNEFSFVGLPETAEYMGGYYNYQGRAKLETKEDELLYQYSLYRHLFYMIWWPINIFLYNMGLKRTF